MRKVSHDPSFSANQDSASVWTAKNMEDSVPFMVTAFLHTSGNVLANFMSRNYWAPAGPFREIVLYRHLRSTACDPVFDRRLQRISFPMNPRNFLSLHRRAQCKSGPKLRVQEPGRESPLSGSLVLVWGFSNLSHLTLPSGHIFSSAISHFSPSCAGQVFVVLVLSQSGMSDLELANTFGPTRPGPEPLKEENRSFSRNEAAHRPPPPSPIVRRGTPWGHRRRKSRVTPGLGERPISFCSSNALAESK